MLPHISSYDGGGLSSELACCDWDGAVGFWLLFVSFSVITSDALSKIWLIVYKTNELNLIDERENLLFGVGKFMCLILGPWVSCLFPRSLNFWKKLINYYKNYKFYMIEILLCTLSFFLLLKYLITKQIAHPIKITQISNEKRVLINLTLL